MPEKGELAIMHTYIRQYPPIDWLVPTSKRPDASNCRRLVALY